MLNIEKKQEGTALTVKLEGRLDTNTAPVFQAEVEPLLANASSLMLDFEKVDYVSSAGLRVIVAMQKRATVNGSLAFRNVVPDVMDVFKMTGFDKILTIE